jgi:hypothetical protein
MSGALNIFKTTLANVTTTTNSVYTPPLGYVAVVLMAQVSNTGNSTIQVSADVLRSGSPTSLISGIGIPSGDAASVLTGRLILQYGDQLEFTSSDDTSAQLVLSFLETLTA